MNHRIHFRETLAGFGGASAVMCGSFLPASVGFAQAGVVPGERPVPVTIAEFEAGLALGPIGAPEVVVFGPTPCDSCDPEDVMSPQSPGYDPTVLAVYQENDALPPPEGPGFATCNGLSATGPFWAGANDHCWGPATASGRDIANVDTQMPSLEPGDHFAICGQVGRIDTSGFTGDPNNPGGALKLEDVDVFQMHLPSDARVKLTAYFQATNIRCAVLFNFDSMLELSSYDPFRDCTDRYGMHLSMSWTPINPAVACESGVWDNNLLEGTYYIVIDPLSSSAIGVPGAQLCASWYNLEIEVFGTEGACCVDSQSGYSCQDGLTGTDCFAIAGTFLGPETTCATDACPVHPCCLASGCIETLSPATCEAAGGIYNINEWSCATAECVPMGACCVDSASGYTCQDNATASQCSTLSGVFQGAGSACASVTCPTRPCCIGPACTEDVSPLECANAGGTYKPLDPTCATVVCAQTGACCFACAGTVVAPCPDSSGPVVTCQVLTAAQCLAARGLYVGDNTTCTQGIGGPCDCGGDVNGDGITNISDFNILSGNFGAGTPNCRSHGQGDLNCDGIVNISDFNILSGNFGCTRN